ncbi:MAG: hypothetical protein LUD72_00900 [Bacteroidales bacterium]|nr:hypothetical protein [Bacteroidales bacterium]
MKVIVKCILLGLLIPLAFVACTEKSLSPSSVPDGLAQIELGVRIPAPVVTRAMSDNENVVVENETTGFVVFAFDSETSSLVWMLKSGDANYESNLSDYRSTTAIKWRTGVFPPGYEVTTDDAQYGTLFIEAPVSSAAMELLVVANVDLSLVSTSYSDGVVSSYTLGTTVLTPSTSLLEDVDEALAAYDYSASTLTGTWGPVTDVWDDDGNENVGLVGTETSNYIPMAGLAALSDGVGSGVTGMVSLRRSLAKVSVTVEFSSADLAKFLPMEMKIVNVNDLASVYAPAGEDGEQVSNIPSTSSTTYTAMTSYASFPSTVSATEALTVSAQLYVPESVTWPTADDRDTHLCVLLGGVFDSDGVYTFDNDGGGTLNDYSDLEARGWSTPLIWYRLDFIPSEATSTEEELEEILRNHHYRFTVSNLAYLGSYSEVLAMNMLYPDNYVIAGSGEGSWTLIVEDEDINSITVAYESSSDDGTDVGVNDYVGVSGVDLTIELPLEASAFTGNEATHLKMVTNYEAWDVESGIELADCEGVFSFSFTEDDEVNTSVYWYNEETGEVQYPAHSGYLWIWADGLSGSYGSATDALAAAAASFYTDGVLNVDKSYTFYICVGVVRKEIHISLVAE